MKNLIAGIALLFLTACSVGNTPEEKYFALNGAITATLRVADEYVKDCNTVPTAQCKETLPKIRTATLKLQKATKEADKVFVAKDVTYYTLSLAVVENALNELRSHVQEK